MSASGISSDQGPLKGLDSGRKRRLLGWINVILMVAFLLGTLIGINLLSRRKYVRLDMTTEKNYELSDRTLKVLQGLDREVKVFLSPVGNAPGMYDNTLNNAWMKILTLSEEYAKRSSKLHFVTVRPHDTAAVTELGRYFPDSSVITPNAIYFVAEGEGGKVNTRALTVRPGEFYDGNPHTGQIDNFRGDHWITMGIQAVTFSRKGIVYFPIGHRELLPLEQQWTGLSVLSKFLADRENVELRPLNLNEVEEIPDDADMVLISGPQDAFPPKELEVVRRYLERGGNLFVALLPKTSTGLGPFLEAWGVKVGDNFLLDSRDYIQKNSAHLNVKLFGNHEINRGMMNTSFPVLGSCTVEPVEKPVGKISVVSLMSSGPSSWEEKGPFQQRSPAQDGEERAGPLSLAVAVRAELEGESSSRKRSHARIVVWGSALSISNQNLSLFGKESPVEYVLNNFRWLMEKENAITIPGRHSGRKPPEVNPEVLGRIFWVTVCGFPGLGVILGLLIWFMRRK